MSEASVKNVPSCDALLLSEQDRREYLRAMGIVSWLPKAEPWQAIVANEVVGDEVGGSKVSKNEISSTEIEEKPFKSDNLLINEPASRFEANSKNTVCPTVEEVIKPTKQVDGEAYPAASQFLKLINWSNQSTFSSGAKTLLIICRHQVDEPASSFTRSNTPSQFMLDYVNSLTEIAKFKGLDLNIQLAHLSQVGLADGSVSFGAGLEKIQPDLALILGDETVAQFMPQACEVSKLRGKQIALTHKIDACTSYHPYTLIQDPSLKRLAFEDLHLVVACLNA